MFSFLLYLSPVHYVENLHILEKEMGKITHVASAKLATLHC